MFYVAGAAHGIASLILLFARSPAAGHGGISLAGRGLFFMIATSVIRPSRVRRKLRVRAVLFLDALDGEFFQRLGYCVGVVADEFPEANERDEPPISHVHQVPGTAWDSFGLLLFSEE